jgi:aromatic ring-cleaving dioxygenase
LAIRAFHAHVYFDPDQLGEARHFAAAARVELG